MKATINHVIDAEIDSARRVLKNVEGTPLPPKKEPKVRISKKGILLIQ